LWQCLLQFCTYFVSPNHFHSYIFIPFTKDNVVSLMSSLESKNIYTNIAPINHYISVQRSSLLYQNVCRTLCFLENNPASIPDSLYLRKEHMACLVSLTYLHSGELAPVCLVSLTYWHSGELAPAHVLISVQAVYALTGRKFGRLYWAFYF
jgi:hypothetical protein